MSTTGGFQLVVSQEVSAEGLQIINAVGYPKTHLIYTNRYMIQQAIRWKEFL